MLNQYNSLCLRAKKNLSRSTIQLELNLVALNVKSFDEKTEQTKLCQREREKKKCIKNSQFLGAGRSDI